MRKIIFFIGFCIMMYASRGQTHIDQNGWKSSVSNLLNAASTQAMRYEVAAVGYNSHHWQSGGLIFIELFNNHYATGYAKFILEIGYTQGANTGSPVLRLVETYGVQQNARITLGDVSDLNTQSGGYSNRRLPIYVDVMKYSRYKVKITFLQTLVDEVTNQNQISFNVTPSGTAIADFLAQTSPNANISGSGNLMITGNGAHYISNGNVGIGTSTPAEKLSVNGNIRAKQIKVEAANWPDYVFDSAYQLMPLEDLAIFIKKNKHLPEVSPVNEVEKNGLDLGSNQAVLLKKIEELTLYILEQEKRIKVLEKKSEANKNYIN